jgi:hypothetical protein
MAVYASMCLDRPAGRPKPTPRNSRIRECAQPRVTGVRRDEVSGRMNWCERAVGKLLTETAQPGDIVMFPESAAWHGPRCRSWRCLSTARGAVSPSTSRNKRWCSMVPCRATSRRRYWGWPLRSSGSSSPCALRRPWRGARLKGWPRSAER